MNEIFHILSNTSNLLCMKLGYCYQNSVSFDAFDISISIGILYVGKFPNCFCPTFYVYEQCLYSYKLTHVFQRALQKRLLENICNHLQYFLNCDDAESLNILRCICE